MSMIAMLVGYQSFTHTTAQYPQALALPYLALGLTDEVAEMLEKIEAGAKSAAICSEVGDVLWYCAQMLSSIGKTFERLPELRDGPAFEATLMGATHWAVIHAGKVAGRAKKTLRDERNFNDEIAISIAELLRALDAIARYFGTNLLIIAGENRAKLEDRLARNAIKGDGDSR